MIASIMHFCQFENAMSTLSKPRLPNPYTPSPFPPSIVSADFKATAHDFIVQELMDIEFSEDGEHLWLHIEKTHLNTAYVAKLLSKWAEIPAHDVSYSGLKDRHAVTSQWFSLRLPKKIAPEKPLIDFVKTWLNSDEKITILAQHWHNKKLQRGTHKFNHFIITLKNVVGEHADINAQLEQIKADGIPNYFGEQRFGQDDNNINTALEFFATGRIDGRKPHPKFNRDKISLYLSASRSELFNATLAKRVEMGKWNTPINVSEEVFNLAGTNSIFTVESQIPLNPPLQKGDFKENSESETDEILQRLANHDIHLTAPMWGAGELASRGEVAELEKSVIASNETYQQLAQGLEKHGLKQQRRATRLLPQNMAWEWAENDLVLKFDLASGSFATSIVAMLLI